MKTWKGRIWSSFLEEIKDSDHIESGRNHKGIHNTYASFQTNTKLLQFPREILQSNKLCNVIDGRIKDKTFYVTLKNVMLVTIDNSFD